VLFAGTAPMPLLIERESGAVLVAQLKSIDVIVDPNSTLAGLAEKLVMLKGVNRSIIF
jgi:hypothetical protein